MKQKALFTITFSVFVTVVFRGPTSLSGDVLQLNEESEEELSTLEKYAFSNALAHSVKLSIWESMLETFVSSIEFVTEVGGKGGHWRALCVCVCVRVCLCAHVHPCVYVHVCYIVCDVCSP